MKAKEYFRKHFAKTPRQVNALFFTKVVGECYAEFFNELQAMVNPLQQIDSKNAKIREFQKKWTAICALIEKHYEVQPNYWRQTDDEQGLIDATDLKSTAEMLNYHLKQSFPHIYRDLMVNMVARDRLPGQLRSTAIPAFDNARFRAILSIVKGEL